MNNLREELKRECPVCKGSGFRFLGSSNATTPCKSCDGTGISAEWRELESDLASVFTCKKCGAKKVHYRLYGYKCPHRCEDES
jgi:DnaJ-class molecular chaperone